MNIFVASRMKNVVERKAVIDAVHRLGHTPIFIEAEQMRSGDDSRPLMDAMLARADAMIAVLDDHTGTSDPNLDGRTPLLYELTEFHRRAAHENAIEVFLRYDFQGNPDSASALKAVCTALPGVGERIRRYTDYDDLAVNAHKLIKERWDDVESVARPAEHLLLKWQGEDEPGRLGAITELLYTDFKLNILHASGTVLGRSATIVLSMTPWTEEPMNPDAIKEALWGELGGSGEVGGHLRPIHVETQAGPPPCSLFHFEIRVLDVPGVLNALCKALTMAGVGIDDLRQRPAGREHKRQSVVMMWLSPGPDNRQDPEHLYLRLESRLRNLVGVQSIVGRRLADPAAAAD